MAVITFQVARVAAPALFAYNILAQIYGVALASPSITDVNDENISYFSPEPIFIAIAFSSVMAIQAYWLWKLIRMSPNSSAGSPDVLETDILPYIPINLLGNVCIGTWVFFWTSSHLALADLLVLISTVVHLAYLFVIAPSLARTRAHQGTTQPDRLTDVVISTFTALGVLDLLHNSSIAFAKDQAPGFIVEALTGVGFVAFCLFGGTIFQAGLVFDLLAFSAGQARYAQGWGWSILLLIYAAVCAAITGGKSYVKFGPNAGVRYGRVAPEDDSANNRIWSTGGDESP